MRSGRFSQLDICSVLSRGFPRTCCTSRLRPFSAESPPTSTSLGPFWGLLTLLLWIYIWNYKLLDNWHSTILKCLNLNLFPWMQLWVFFIVNYCITLHVQQAQGEIFVCTFNSHSLLMSCNNILFQPDIPCDFAKYVLHSSCPATCSLLQQMVKKPHQLLDLVAISTFLSPPQRLWVQLHTSQTNCWATAVYVPGLASKNSKEQRSL